MPQVFNVKSMTNENEMMKIKFQSQKYNLNVNNNQYEQNREDTFDLYPVKYSSDLLPSLFSY